jgi:hypothetical protein
MCSKNTNGWFEEKWIVNGAKTKNRKFIKKRKYQQFVIKF